MRILVISDIHANLTALEAILRHAGEFDSAWCLGDLVGYGPDPNECVSLVQELPNLTCIIGNHDAAALMQIDADTFNPEARNALLWTRKALTESSKVFLRDLPEKVVVESVTLSHGSPRHPVWEYLLDTQTAALNFEFFETPFCFVGHTHLPVIYTITEEERDAHLIIPEPGKIVSLHNRAIVNPGSVGQPRDRDPRTAYAIYDLDDQTWHYQRIPYDIASVQGRMQKAGLPERHIQRLSGGW